MPTRSIKLKLIVPRSDAPEDARLRRALWETHAFTNEAIAFYEDMLLELRQQDVVTRRTEDGDDVVTPASVYQGRLIARLKRRGLDDSRIQQALPLLRRLYERMVESSVKPGSGSGQAARGYHGLLVDPNSAAGEAKNKKAELLSTLKPLIQGDPDVFRAAADALLETHSADLIYATGAPTTWAKAWQSDRAGSDWVRLLLTALEKLPDPLERQIRELDAVPLGEPFGQGRLEAPKRGALSNFERSAFAMAVEHLNTWESWGHLAREAKRLREEKRDKLQSQIEQDAPDALRAIRAWERQREVHLATLGDLGRAPTYRLRLRELRGWSTLRDQLKRVPSTDGEARAEVVKEAQRKDPRGFGGEAALAWLAAPEQSWLVAHAAGDVVSRVAALNSYIDVCERTHGAPLFTAAQAVAHPRFMKFGKPGDNNSAGYRLAVDDAGHLCAYVDILRRDERSGLLSTATIPLRVAPTRQLARLQVTGGGKELGLSWERQDRSGLTQGELQGGNLILSRRALAARSEAELSAGRLGSVWLKIAVSVGDENAPALAARSKSRAWLSSAARERQTSKHAAPPAGFRLLAVDLGVRAAATVSIFTLGPVEGRNPWPLHPEAPFVAVHERSLTLRLPGEDPDRRDLEAREGALKRLRSLRRALSQLRQLRRLAVSEGAAQRAEILQALAEPRPGAEPDAVPLPAQALVELAARVNDPPELWMTVTSALYDAHEHRLGEAIRDWRQVSRQKGVRARGGKSMWAIDYLDRCYRLLRAWGRRQRPSRAKVMRPLPTYARRLRDHINHLRDDRVKTTADLIVQAARGMVYQDGAWVRALPPSDLIVFEDLSRYRFQTDRPRSENTQLMRWAHRQIVDVVRMQAQVEGIPVADTGAAFTSQFDARTGAPGVRCHAISREDLTRLHNPDEPNFWLTRVIEGRLARLGIDRARLRVGDLVPTGSGKLLATLAPNGGLRILDADVNAAQGLARRYIEGHQTAFRLVVQGLSGTTPRRAFADLSSTKRLRGAIGAPLVVFEQTPDGRCWTQTGYGSRREVARALGMAVTALPGRGEQEEAEETPDGAGSSGRGDEAAALEDADRVLQEVTLERIVLFRDPSGQIERGEWLEAERFIGMVRAMVLARLRRSGRIGG